MLHSNIAGFLRALQVVAGQSARASRLDSSGVECVYIFICKGSYKRRGAQMKMAEVQK